VLSVDLTLAGTLADFSAEAQEAMLRGLAQLLELPLERFSIAEIRAGSLLVRVAVIAQQRASEAPMISQAQLDERLSAFSLEQLSDAMGVQLLEAPRLVRAGCVDPAASNFDSEAIAAAVPSTCAYNTEGDGGGGGSTSSESGSKPSVVGDASPSPDSLSQAIDRLFRDQQGVAAGAVLLIVFVLCLCMALSALLAHRWELRRRDKRVGGEDGARELGGPSSELVTPPLEQQQHASRETRTAETMTTPLQSARPAGTSLGFMPTDGRSQPLTSRRPLPPPPRLDDDGLAAFEVYPGVPWSSDLTPLDLMPPPPLTRVRAAVDSGGRSLARTPARSPARSISPFQLPEIPSRLKPRRAPRTPSPSVAYAARSPLPPIRSVLEDVSLQPSREQRAATAPAPVGRPSLSPLPLRAPPSSGGDAAADSTARPLRHQGHGSPSPATARGPFHEYQVAPEPSPIFPAAGSTAQAADADRRCMRTAAVSTAAASSPVSRAMAFQLSSTDAASRAAVVPRDEAGLGV
jgi:hypothetical protein